MEPCSCDTFVALPPTTFDNRIIFGKNSDRPSEEVQEVVYFPAQTYGAGAKVECTYIIIEQVERTNAVVLSRPSWLWGAEMGANEHGVCIGNEAIWGKEDASAREALLGMDLVRLGLERADSAEEALEVITGLLERHGQGGNCVESQMSFLYHNSFMIVDRREAWILETSGRFWAAEQVKGGSRNMSNVMCLNVKIDREHPEMRPYARSKGWWDGKKIFNFTGAYSFYTPTHTCQEGERFYEGFKLLNKYKENITAELMIEILSDKPSGINMVGGFMTTGSMVSILPKNPSLPCCHFFTGTPDPSRSVFKPFVFAPENEPLVHTVSPVFGSDDPVKKFPRFQTIPDRRHELYKRHESAMKSEHTTQTHKYGLVRRLKALENQMLEEVESLLRNRISDVSQYAFLFSKCLEEEMKIYS